MAYKYEENLGLKGPKSNSNKSKAIGLRMTMLQAAGVMNKSMSLFQVFVSLLMKNWKQVFSGHCLVIRI